MDVKLPEFTLRRNRRSKSIRITVVSGGEVFVSAPFGLPYEKILSFVEKHREWIRDKVGKYKKFPKKNLSKSDEKKLYKKYKAEAFQFTKKKVDFWNSLYKFSFKKISIRNSKTRWGSCSSKGTLSFNYKILFLPAHVSDYLVIHELCHIKEKNHGPAFWSLVALKCPEFRKTRAQLRDFEKSFRPDLLGV